MFSTSNDNQSRHETILAGGPGQAAILLVESLIHGLIAKSLLSVADAVEVIDTAASVSREMAEEGGEAPPRIQGSVALLEAMSRSLSRDLQT